MKVKIGVIILGSVAVQGCMTSYVEWIEKGVRSNVPAEGIYEINGSFASFKDDGKIVKGFADRSTIPVEGSALPIIVDLTTRSEDTTSGLACLNNFVSACTLGVWPWIESLETKYTVSVKSPSGTSITDEVLIGRRQWRSFLLPIAVIPCPGWGEVRGYSDKQDSVLGMKASKNAVRAVLNRSYYEKEMSRYISLRKEQECQRKYEEQKKAQAEKEWQDKKAAAARGIQDVLATQNKRYGTADRRVVVLLDRKDIQDRTSSASRDNRDKVGDITAVVDELEATLSKLGFRVVTKRSIERSIEDKALFDAQNISSKQHDSIVENPSYRAEAVVYQYGVESKKTDSLMSGRDRTVMKTQTTRMVGRVELSLKFINVQTGETEYSIQRVLRECVDERTGKEFSGFGRTFMKTGGGANPMVEEAVLSRALKEAFYILAVDIVNKLKPIHVIECSDDAKLVIDATDAVVSVGDKLKMFAVGKGKIRNGRVHRQETAIADLHVESVSDNACTAVFDNIGQTNCEWNVVLRPQIDTDSVLEQKRKLEKKKKRR